MYIFCTSCFSFACPSGGVVINVFPGVTIAIAALLPRSPSHGAEAAAARSYRVHLGCSIVKSALVSVEHFRISHVNFAPGRCTWEVPDSAFVFCGGCGSWCWGARLLWQQGAVLWGSSIRGRNPGTVLFRFAMVVWHLQNPIATRTLIRIRCRN